MNTYAYDETIYLLNVNNGVYDLRQKRLIDRLYPTYNGPTVPPLYFNYVKDASIEDAPNFKHFLETFLHSANEPAKQTLLLEIMGMCISNMPCDKSIYVFTGEPTSGKSIIANLITSMLPDPKQLTVIHDFDLKSNNIASIKAATTRQVICTSSDISYNDNDMKRMTILKFNPVEYETQDKHVFAKLFTEKDIIFTLAINALQNLYDNDCQ